MTDDRDAHRLQSIEIDEDSLAPVSRDQEQERQIAIFDLVEDNYFQPEGAANGPYDLKIALAENRLALHITGPEGGFDQIHLLSLSPFRGVIRDYFMICESYYQAIRNATPGPYRGPRSARASRCGWQGEDRPGHRASA